MKQSLDGAYFDRVYEASGDPWHFETSAYEHEKYRRTLDTLGGPYGNGLEIGCSIGVLTAMLAPAFAALLAIDINARALESARERCAGLKNVAFAQMAFPREMPDGRFDAVVLSEVGYYWSDADLSLAIDRIATAAAGGVLQLVHFLPKVEEYVRDGDAVHEAFLRDPRYARALSFRAERYRIDVLRIR